MYTRVLVRSSERPSVHVFMGYSYIHMIIRTSDVPMYSTIFVHSNDRTLVRSNDRPSVQVYIQPSNDNMYVRSYDQASILVNTCTSNIRTYLPTYDHTIKRIFHEHMYTTTPVRSNESPMNICTLGCSLDQTTVVLNACTLPALDQMVA